MTLMTPRSNGIPPEECFAFIEVDELGPDPRPLLDDIDPSLVIARSASSPAGFSWFELGVKGHPIERQAAIAGAALRVLSDAAAGGALLDFRIIRGAHFLDMATPAADATI